MGKRSTGRVDLEKMRRAYEESRERTKEMPVLTQRAVARIDSNLHMTGRIGRFRIESDEPKERGGEDVAPAPLQYVVAGAAFWLLTQLAKFSPLYEVPIHDAEVDVRATFSVADKFDLGGPPGAFQRVTFQLEIDSSAPASDVAHLVAHAERACHAAQTFRTAVQTDLSARLNGRPLAIPEPWG
jgi:uncharacterized OsmC-like protein